MSGEARTEQIGDLVSPLLDRLGFDLEDVVLLTPPGRRDIRIVVDRDGGSTLDELADVSRAIETALDDADVLGAAPYELEVTTPGIGRPLTLPRHWRRSQGRKVKVECTVDGRRESVEARVGVSDDHRVTLVLVDKNRIGTLDVAYVDIANAVVDVDFSRPGEAALRACGLDDDEVARRRDSGTPQQAD